MHKQVKCVSFSKWKLFWNYITSSQADIICVQEHKQVESSGQVGTFRPRYNIWSAYDYKT